MKILRSAVFLAVFAFAVASSGAQPAATPTKGAALAGELLGLLKVDKTMEAAFASMTQMQASMGGAANATPEQRAKAQQRMEAVLGEVKSVMSWEKIKPMFVEIYAEVFTPEELQGMIDFFRSPVGQKWIEKQPQLQAATMQKMQGLMREMQPKIRAAVERAGAGASPADSPR